MVEGGGFEPPKVEPADLQSAPFDRSGTPPKIKPHILLEHSATVNRNVLLRRIFFSAIKLQETPVSSLSALKLLLKNHTKLKESELKYP